MACPNEHPIDTDDLEPRSFSFNSPFGACPVCHGLGTRMEVDAELVVADPGATLGEGAIGPWSGAHVADFFTRLLGALGDELGFDLNTPWEDLPATASALDPGRARDQGARPAHATATAASAPTTPASRGSGPTSSAGTGRPSPTPAGSGSRASCARCRARRAAAAGSSRCPWRSPWAARTSPRSAACRSTRPRTSWPRSSCRAREADRRAGAQGDPGAAELPARRGAGLPLPGPPVGVAVGRRGAADPAGDPDRRRPGGGALRARRAVDRSAPARQPPADRDAGAAQGPRQHPHRRRARRGHHPGRRLGGRHRARGGRARRPGGRLRSRAGAAGPPGLLDRDVPVRPQADPGARGPSSAHPGSRAGRAGCSRAQPAGHRRPLPARHARRGHRGLRLGQVDAGQRHPLHLAGQADLQRPHGAGPAPADRGHGRGRQGHPRRPVADRPYAALQPGDLHRGVRPRPQALRVHGRGQGAGVPAGPVLVQREGRTLRGLLTATARSRSR